MMRTLYSGSVSVGDRGNHWSWANKRHAFKFRCTVSSRCCGTQHGIVRHRSVGRSNRLVGRKDWLVDRRNIVVGRSNVLLMHKSSGGSSRRGTNLGGILR